MKKVYIVPEAETIDFSVEEILMNDLIGGDQDTSYVPEDEWDD